MQLTSGDRERFDLDLFRDEEFAKEAEEEKAPAKKAGKGIGFKGKGK